MTKSPIEIMLDKVEWKRIYASTTLNTHIPYATHEGILNIGGIELKVYQLSTGQRVIAEEDLIKFFSPASPDQ